MYNYEYEDFYEPSQYDELVEEFKEELRKSVVREWVDKMNALEKENESLQEIKKNFEAIKAKYERMKSQCEYEKMQALNNAKRDARKETLSELFREIQLDYWKITTKRVEKPKCDKCNSNRMIEYITPLGRKATEYCTCHDSEEKFVPDIMTIYEIRLFNHKLDTWFVRKYEDKDVYVNAVQYLGSKVIIDDDADVTEIQSDNKYNLWFKTFEKCQEYCDYLNKEKT